MNTTLNDMIMPYFMTNEKWYYYDEFEEIYKLTKEAPDEAIKSYNEFYATNDEID